MGLVVERRCAEGGIKAQIAEGVGLKSQDRMSCSIVIAHWKPPAGAHHTLLYILPLRGDVCCCTNVIWLSAAYYLDALFCHFCRDSSGERKRVGL